MHTMHAVHVAHACIVRNHAAHAVHSLSCMQSLPDTHNTAFEPIILDKTRQQADTMAHKVKCSQAKEKEPGR